MQVLWINSKPNILQVNNFTIIPSSLQYKSAPSVDQDITVSLDEKQQLITEYTRSQTVSLAQVYDDERQSCTVFII